MFLSCADVLQTRRWVVEAEVQVAVLLMVVVLVAAVVVWGTGAALCPTLRAHGWNTQEVAYLSMQAREM